MNLDAVSILTAERVTANGNGDAVDVRDFHGWGHLILNASATEGADHTLDVSLEHSDNGTDGWEAVSDVSFAQVDNSGASFQQVEVQTDKLKQYVRGVDTIAGSTPAGTRALSLVGVKKY